MKRGTREFRAKERPVQHIELSEKYIKPRGFLALFLLAFGLVCIGYGLLSALETEPGWQEVEAIGSQLTCAGDFVLMYDFTDAGKEASAQSKELAALYTDAAEAAFRAFSPEVEEEGLGNVAWLNSHVNQPVTVEEPLYRALEQVVAWGDRRVFAAPMAQLYRNVFSSQSDEEAAQYDPAVNEALGAYLAELSAFVRDPEAVSLELLGDSKVQLTVSEAYLAFAQANELDRFLDFDWMTNAFLADELARVLAENGFTCGYLTSDDGFTRNLDDRGTGYYTGLLARSGDAVAEPARMTYQGPMSLVFLRSYRLSDTETWQGYTYADGKTVTALLDPQDGMSKSAADSLLAYSNTAGCGELLLRAGALFVAEELDGQGLADLAGEGIFSVWCDGESLRYNDPDLSLERLDGGQYPILQEP